MCKASTNDQGDELTHRPDLIVGVESPACLLRAMEMLCLRKVFIQSLGANSSIIFRASLHPEKDLSRLCGKPIREIGPMMVPID